MSHWRQPIHSSLRSSAIFRRPSIRSAFTSTFVKRVNHSQPVHQFYRNISTDPLLTSTKSSVSPTAVAVGLFIGFGTVFAWQRYNSSSASAPLEPIHDTINLDQEDSTPPRVRVYPGMPATIPPGYPGNLSPEQEAKLRELWEAVLSITSGTGSKATSMDLTASDASSVATSNVDTKKKHGLGRVFGRSSAKSAEPAASEGEDKHGQTKEYREALASQTPEQLRSTFWSFTKSDDPDALLCRFLRARKWDVHAALVMLVSTIHWRAQVVKLDEDIVYNGELAAAEASASGSGAQKKLGEDFMTQLRLGKSFVHGTDKTGRPMCFVRVRLHRAGEQSEESLERFTVYTIETARLMLRPPVDTAVIVFDMTGFSMSNMDYNPVKFMIKVFEANYPESLGLVLVHHSPWIFQGIWSIIRGWLDPVVASKVHFTKDARELSEFIPAYQIPKELGGEENWEYKYVEPVRGENDAMRDTATRQKVQSIRNQMVDEYERATAQWVREGGDAVNRKRLQLADQMRDNYWKLDPYIRAKTVYDRTGVIRPGGVIDMYSKGGAGAVGGRHDDLD